SITLRMKYSSCEDLPGAVVVSAQGACPMEFYGELYHSNQYVTPLTALVVIHALIFFMSKAW
ncbi:hypothetical protein, partial [Desulfobulbus alkaliphilus]|uniref:hypothetical protein n=1 Tax=Desulfobulbus alkaliphilus TaxID=869814 RepID=UPI001964B067